MQQRMFAALSERRKGSNDNNNDKDNDNKDKKRRGHGPVVELPRLGAAVVLGERIVAA